MRSIFFCIISGIFLVTNAWCLELSGLLNQLQQKSKGWHSLKAHFVQQTVLVVGMKRTKQFEGELYLKRPQMIRWDYVKPYKYHIISNGEKIWFYDEPQKQVMVGKLSRFFNKQIFYSLFLNIKNVTKFFKIKMRETANTFQLILNPYKSLVNPRHIVVIIDKRCFEIKKVQFTDIYGNQNLITFSRFCFNVPLKKSLFEFKACKGLEIIKIP